jgi:hypothetical protein
MFQHNKPSREQVREWLKQEVGLRRPPPDPAEIRHHLGWGLVEVEYDDRFPRERLDAIT